MQRRLRMVPVGLLRPACVLELMLNIEQPNANRRGYEEIGPWIMKNGRGPTSHIRRATTVAIPMLVDIVEIQGFPPGPAHETERGAMLQQEEIGGADANITSGWR